MAEQHAALARALGARGAHPVGVDVGQEQRAVQADVGPHEQQQLDQPRQPQVLHRGPALLVAVDGEPVELEREQVLQREHVHQCRHAHRRDEQRARRAVDDAVAVARDEQRDRHVDDGAEHERRHRHRQAHQRARLQLLPQVVAGDVGLAVVERDDLAQEVDELHRQRLVQPPLVAQVGHRLQRGVVAQRRAHRVGPERVEQQEREQRHAEHGGDGLQQAADDVRAHQGPFFLAAASTRR